ncbi:MAG: proton-coupled thiamine transporter YuaJ [Ruminococcaceae bacterium]|nr:proton-coupled thiamine transporter YuaJ [Oscillospiraceae bacterium]
MSRTYLRKLTVSAILIALATGLSFIKLWQNPWGGSVTLLSMLPIVLIPILFGTRWGLFAAFVNSLVQFGVGFIKMMSWGMDARMWIGAVVFDFVVAYTVLGLAAIFAKKGTLGLSLGIIISLTLRFISHFISGYIFFDSWMPETFTNPAVYSLVYNGTYMLPELILTLTAVLILYKTSTISRIKHMVK